MKYIILFINLVTIALAQAVAPASARVSIQSDRAGLKVWLDNDSIGVTPIVNYAVAPGDYWVTLFNPDSTQDRYRILESGSIGEKLSTIWAMARVAAGSTRITAKPDETKNVFLSMRKAERAPCQAKWLAAGCVAVPTLLGGGLGVLITLLVQK